MYNKQCYFAKIKPLAESEWGAIKGGYQMAHCEVACKRGWTFTVIQTAAQVSLTLANLTLYQTYTFKIRSFNIAGTSAWSADLTFYFDLGNWIVAPPMNGMRVFTKHVFSPL